MTEHIASQVTSVHNTLMLAALLGIGLTGSVAVTPSTSDTLAQRVQVGKVVETTPKAARIGFGGPSATGASVGFKSDHYAQLREQMRWLPVRLAGNELKTPDASSRLLLAQSAAERAGLDEVGLSYRDVYGIINAETSWIPRLGSSKDGTPNLGIAQFEPATARAVGLDDPSDPVQAVHAAAMHLKEAARWSARRIADLKLSPEQHALKLREGVSIYYNLSSKGRSQWNGLNTAKLPVETRRHIANARVGAREAAELEAQLRDLKDRMGQPGVMTVSLPHRGS
jgi:hypothetical protein